MTKGITTLILLLSYCSIFAKNSDAEIIESAKIYCNSIKNDVDSLASQQNINSNELLAIIFPEACRYSELQNQIETSALAYFYVQFGSSTSDFSIGHFQMKPSFVEQIEKHIINNQDQFSDLNHLLIDTSQTIEKQRRERFIRLSNQFYQIKYLCCFYRIVNEFTTLKKFITPEEKTAFYAKYYNAGINNTPAQIQNLIDNEKTFKLSSYWWSNDYKYTQLSVSFYKSLNL